MNAPVILVTGGARRVGADICRMLHAAGASIALHYRSSVQDAMALAEALNANRPDTVACFSADLLEGEKLQRLVSDVLGRFGRLDALVNNASSFFATPLGAITPDDWEDLMGSNLKAPLFLSQAAAQVLRASSLEGGGSIVNITDVHAERPLKGYPVYCAAKAGLLGLTRSLAIELGPSIRVNAVAPGAIQWPDEREDFPQTERDAIVEHTLLKRVGSPLDIARAVKFLIFDAPYVTGQVLNVDGGRTAHL